MKSELATIAVLIITAGRFLKSNDSLDDEFNSWKRKNHKSYSNKAEQSGRKNTYRSNKDAVNSHNKQFEEGLETYRLGMNKFSDLTFAQFERSYLQSTSLKVSTSCAGTIPAATVPSTLDWTDLGAVTPVKDQGSCGSCYSFSATGSLQGLYFNNNGNLLSFSQQQIVDCSGAYGNFGCNGGFMDTSLLYVKDNGITTQDQYPYTGRKGTCTYTSDMEVFRNADCADVTKNNQNALLLAITKGPVSVAVQATRNFQLYQSGIFSERCKKKLNHAVLAVGFGTKFYKIKNSWGEGWGESGYIRLKRTGNNSGTSCVQMDSSIAL